MIDEKDFIRRRTRERTILDEGFLAALERKWRPLLENINDPYKRKVMAVLYENEADHLKYLTEETRTTNVGEFTKYIFPIIRRVWPNLIAHDLVSIQPMTAAVGAIFYYEIRYGTTKGRVTRGENIIEKLYPEYSSNQIIDELVGIGNGSATTFNATLGFKPVLAKSLNVFLAGTLVAIDDGAGNLAGVGGSGVTGTINYDTGEISVTFPTAPPENAKITVNYKYNLELNPQIPEIYIDLAFSEVRAEPRKLKAIWSPEAAEDLRAFHGIDAEAELVAAMASEITLEIDRSIIYDILANATETTATWSAAVPQGISDVEHYRSILTPISRISNEIHRKTLRGPANWIVTSPDVHSIISQLATYGFYRPIFAPAGSETHAPVEAIGTPGYGIYKAGTLQERWTVYVDPYFPRDKVLIGLKGRSFLDAGYVYAPYIPLQMTPTFFDPNDMSLKKGLRTRYATKLIRKEFYGVLTVTDL
mgnify:CR=1 FL=1